MNKSLYRSNTDGIHGSRARGLAAVAIAFAMLAVGCLVLSNYSDPASADPSSGNCGDNLTWNYADGTLTISGTGAMTDYDDCGPWHSYVSTMKTIVVGEGCTHIGNNAFHGLGGVNSVTLPASLESIGNSAFMSCYVVTSFSLGKNVSSIGSQAFASCADLREIKVDSENSHFCDVGGVLFDKGKETLIKFPDHMFNTYEYTIPSGTLTLGADSFSGNSGLQKVTVPASVTTIEQGAFNHGTWLEKIIVEDGNTAYSSEDGVLFDKNKTTLIQFPSRNEVANNTYTVPSTVTAISAKAFENNDFLQSIILPDNLTAIGDRAFDLAQSLTSITVPAKATALGVSLFVNSGLQSVTVNAAVETLPAKMFDYCSDLTSVTLPSGLKDTGEYTFEGCHGLTSITLPASVTTIGEGTFSDCTALATVGFPASLTTIGAHAFEGCNALPHEFAIPEGVTTISDNAFAGCGNIQYVSLSTTVEIIGAHAFQSCGNLNGISLSDSLTSIGDYAFSGTSLLYIYIPEGVTSIGESAFSGCSHISDIYIPSTVTNFGQSLFSYDFYNGDTKLEMQDTVGKAFSFRYFKYQQMSGIMLDSMGGSPVWPITGEAGADAKEPYPQPTKFACKFDGWYADKGLQTPYTFTKIPNGVIFVYAKWTSNAVTFDNQNGTVLSADVDGSSADFTTASMTDIKNSAASNPEVTMEVTLEGGRVIFDNAALNAMSSSAATLSLSQLSKDDLPADVRNLVGDNPVIDISFGDKVDFGEGKVTVTVPYVLKDGQDAGDLVVCFIKDGKIAERFDCTYSDGKVTFTTSHFSMYALMDETPRGLSGTVVAAAGAILIVCILLAVLSSGAAVSRKTL